MRETSRDSDKKLNVNNNLDTSCYEAYMRMSKPFAMRYPLVDCQGNNGTIIMLNDEAAMRYTELRLNNLSQYLYGGLEEDAIKEWRINFDKTEQYPSVMPSIGYYNLCNGTIGLGVGISSQIPQFNLKEVNEAIVKLIKNPAISDDEIIVMPDFATGATLMNPEEVKQSLIVGKGKACCLRAKMHYDPAEHALKVTEIPYSIGTDTIREEIAKLLEKDENYGIDNISDNSGTTVDFIIYLKKNVSVKKMMEKLYKDTSLENSSPIVMWVLDKGRFPVVMGLRQLFNAYINHCRETETNILTDELEKLNIRNNIVNGLVKANADIDNVIALIRGSSSSEEAKNGLLALGYNEEQVKAILSIKLSSLNKLDVDALLQEQTTNAANIKWHEEILADSNKLDGEIIKKLEEVANKFGDTRRTTIYDSTRAIVNTNDEGTPAALILFDNNMMRAVDPAELQPGNRGRKGANIKPPRGATVKSTIYTSTSADVAIFTDAGKMYTFSLSDMEFGTDYSVYEFIELQDSHEKVVEIVDASSMESNQWTIFITKNGFIKKTNTEEYLARARKGFIALKLDPEDTLQNVFFSNSLEDKLMIANNTGRYVYYAQSEVSSTGRNARGVISMNLMSNEYVVDATLLNKDGNYQGILSVSKNGNGKITPLDDFPATSRAVKGNVLMRLDEDDNVSAVSVIPCGQNTVSLLTNKLVSLAINKIPTQGRSTKGVLLIDNRKGTNLIHIL